MRFKQRYLVFEFVGSGEPFKIIPRSFSRFFGVLGLANTRYKFVEYDKVKKMGIFRCSLNSIDMFRCALCLVNKFDNELVGFRIIGVSGSIKQARIKFL